MVELHRARTAQPRIASAWQGAQAKIRVMVKRILNRFGYPPDLQEAAVKEVLAQAALLCADWAA